MTSITTTIQLLTNLIVEEVDRVLVELEGEGFQEGDVVGEHLLVREVQFQHNDGVDVVVREKIVYAMDNRHSL